MFKQMAKSTKGVALIVRRGALRRFHKLTQKTAEMPVTVLWDRRTSERRSAAESTGRNRRKQDRRQKPPFTWDVSDFVVAALPQRKKRKPQ
jgi:hypothetical protein